MKKEAPIYLPGLNKQYEFLIDKLELKNLKILVLGGGSTEIANQLYKKSNIKVELIVEDFETLLITQLGIKDLSTISVKLMDFESTDFKDAAFDLIYAQGSVSDSRRKRIVKEVKRILKPEGYFCVGEIIKLEDEVPNFVRDIFDSSNLLPLNKSEIKKYYLDKGFELIDSIDLSNTLTEYYKISSEQLSKSEKSLTENEKSYYKKLLNKITHESNAYLKLGAKRYIGFKVLLLRKVLN